MEFQLHHITIIIDYRIVSMGRGRKNYKKRKKGENVTPLNVNEWIIVFVLPQTAPAFPLFVSMFSVYKKYVSVLHAHFVFGFTVPTLLPRVH